MRDRQEQASGDTAANFQAGGDIVINAGLTAAEVLAMIKESLKANLFDMRGIAKEVFDERADHFVDDVVERLAQENPESIKQAAEPDFHITLLEAAKSYGRSGNEDLGELLVDLLVERVGQPDRSLAKIVLGEALTVAPKMTQAHLDALTVSWVMRAVRFTGVNSVAVAVNTLASHLGPFIGDWEISSSSYQHLQYLGCGQVSVLNLGFDQCLPERLEAAPFS